MPSNQEVLLSCSIDDGHPSDMKAFELLQRHGINATFFVPIRNREGMPMMSKSNLREIAARYEIGSHTYDHCFLHRLDAPVAQYQVVHGKQKLEELIDRPVPGFCYPGGKYRRAHAQLVKNAGFDYARTTMNLCFEAGQRRFEMPTTAQFYPHPRAVYLRNFAKGGHWRRRHKGLQLALQNDDWMARLYALFDHAAERGGVFHLWGHSKDIDELNAWHKFDQFLRHVAARVPAKNRLTNHQLAQHEFPSKAFSAE